MKHYIIIEVRESDDSDGLVQFRYSHAYAAGRIRKNLHEFCLTNGINAADCIVREDRPFVHGTGQPQPYSATQALFRRAMGPLWRSRHAASALDAAPFDTTEVVR